MEGLTSRWWQKGRRPLTDLPYSVATAIDITAWQSVAMLFFFVAWLTVPMSGSQWTPNYSHNSAMEGTRSACKRRWFECCHLSMPPPWPTVCAGPACVCGTLVFYSQAGLIPWASSQLSLPPPWASQKERLQWKCERSRAQCFHPSSTGSFGREATTFCRHLADLISSKQQKHYSNAISWLRCRLSIAILQSELMCVRGSHLSHHCPRCEVNITLASSGGLPM